MILSFADEGTAAVFHGLDTRQARRTCPVQLWPIAARKLDQLDSAASLADLRIPPGNRLEALAADRKGQHSIRINARYRICFDWSAGGPRQVEIVDYHR